MQNSVIIILAVALPLFYFLLRSWSSYTRTKDLQEYFLGETLTSTGFFATLSMSMAGLANILFVFAIWGYQYGFSAILYGFLFWVFGLLFFRYIFNQPRIKLFVSAMGTLHEFLGSRHGADGHQIRSLAAKVSIASFLIVIGFEIYIGSQILQVFVPADNIDALGLTTNQSVLGAAMLLCLLVSAYSAIGGYRAVIETDIFQGILLIIALTMTIYLTFDSTISELSKVTLKSFVFGPGDFGFWFFVGTNIIGWTLWFPTTMDMWQRCAATRSVEIPSKQILCSLTGFFALTVFGVTIGIFVKANTAQDYYSLFPLLDFLRIVLGNASESTYGIWPLALLLTGFIAAMMSTVDTFTIAATQAYFSDIRLAPKFNSLSEVPIDIQQRELNLAMLSAFLIPVSTFLVFFIIHLAKVSPVGVFVIGYSLQLALLFPILFSVFGNPLGFRETRRSIFSGVIAVAITGAIATGWIYQNSQEQLAWYLLYSIQILAVAASGATYLFFYFKTIRQP